MPSCAGYFESHRPQYEEIRFVSLELALREVNENHPRLTSEALSKVNLNHIDRVDYELNLNDEHDTDLGIGIAELFQARLGQP